MKQLAVIGGGPAGLAAAIQAARYGASVRLYEAADRVGGKIPRTGNGRCNLTNTNLSPRAYNAPAFVRPVLEEYGVDRVLAFFKQANVLTRAQSDGRVFPLSNSAYTVLDALRLHCRQRGVEIITNFNVIDFNWRENNFVLMSHEGNVAKADVLVVACGGSSDILNAAGHHMSALSPALCPLKTTTDAIYGLSGIRVYAQVSAYDHKNTTTPYLSEFGEVLFRDYGLSGIVIFDFSRYVSTGDILSLDLLPKLSEDDVVQLLINHRDILLNTQDAPKPNYSELLTGMFHPRVTECVIRAAGLRSSQTASEAKFICLARAAKNISMKVLGKGSFKQAQVTRGGFLLEEFDPSTLQSRLQPGLFAAGEILNVDGRCGGYNLHWAWASGLCAGGCAAKI